MNLKKWIKQKKDLVTTIKLSTEKNIELPVNNISNDKESNDPEHPTLNQQYKKLLKQLNEPESNSKQTAKQLKQVRQDISQQTQSELQEFAKNTPTLSKNKPDHEEPSL